MKSLLTMAVLSVTLATACYAQDAVSITGKGKQKWSQSEINRVYLSACSAVQREFYSHTAPRPTVALIHRHPCTCTRRRPCRRSVRDSVLILFFSAQAAVLSANS